MFNVNSLLIGKKRKKNVMSSSKQFSLLIDLSASLEFFFSFFPTITSCVIRPIFFVS